MADAYATPGVYIEEFAPGSPIQGVGTSTAAFIGTTLAGPALKPTLVQSWDAFVAQFGGFTEQPTMGFLAPSVFGFFLNGGTACYVVRASAGGQAHADLPARNGANPAQPALLARARAEGTAGNQLTVEVAESSALADLLANLQPPLPAPAPKTLAVWRAQAAVQALSQDRRELTVNDNAGFAPGDRVLLGKGADSQGAIVQGVGGTATLKLVAAVAGNVDFAGGTVRTADLAPQQRSLRLKVPPGLSLARALPRGTTVSIAANGVGEVGTVQDAGGDTVVLAEGLAKAYALDDPNKLPQLGSLEFDLTVTDTGTVPQRVERFTRLSMGSGHPAHWSGVTSTLVALELPDKPPNPQSDDPRPAKGSYTLAGGQPDDRQQAVQSVINAPNALLDLLKPYDDVSLVCAPGFTDKAVQQALRDHCEAMHDRFAILDSRPGALPGNGIRDQVAEVRSDKGFAALYYPWITQRNPLTGQDQLCPPSGHLAGIYARTDTERGVHKAPANTNIRGALGLERVLSDDEQGPLNLLGINVLRVFRGQGQPVVWGARTTAQDDRNWQYVSIRRLFLFLEESIQEGIRWAVFEPNDLALWQKLKRSITEFLTRVWHDGALFGATADKAFYVRIDEALNPPSTRALGQLHIEIGVQPAYPAEFIVVRIGIWDGGAAVNEA
jgi:phage tail sheath protein FI